MLELCKTLMELTLRDPRAAARALMGLGLSRQVLWWLLWLVIVLSVISASINAALLPPLVLEDGVTALRPSPLSFVFLMVPTLLLMLAGSFYIGKMFGGTARFEDILAIITWMQFISLLIQLVQTVMLIVMPGLVDIIGIVAAFFLIWLFTNFIAEAHGFASRLFVFFGIIGSIIAFSMLLLILLSVVGVSITNLQ